MYKDIVVDASTGGKAKWLKVLVGELVTASAPKSSVPPHYLEPLYYFGKRKKPVLEGQHHCPVCKTEFTHNHNMLRHVDLTHSFNGMIFQTRYNRTFG